MSYFNRGDWYSKYLMTYDNKIMEEFNEQIMKETCVEEPSSEEQLKERILQLEGKLEDASCELEIIKSEVKDMLSALSTAVENGVQLNIGIVLGQIMSKLTDILDN